MKPAPFEYAKARSVKECVDILERRGAEQRFLSGGQSLVPLMNLRLARPKVLVDVNGLGELAYVRRDGGVLEVGALTRHCELAEGATVQQSCPLVSSAASRIGYPAIRNRGTLGGSLAHADPAGELPCACVALGAEVAVRGPDAERRVPAGDFFISHFTTSLLASEMVVAVRFPVIRSGQGWAFEEFARKTGDFALVAVGALVVVGGTTVEGASIAVSGLGGRPIRLPAAELALLGETWSDELMGATAAAVAAEVAALVHEPADGFRPHVAGVLAARALRHACTRATGEEAPGGR